MKPPIPERLGVDLMGGSPEVRLAGQILIGLELAAMKAALGYEGGGSWQQHRGENGRSTRPLWTVFCRTGAGVSDVTVLKFIRMGKAVQRRFAGRPATKGFAERMDSPPSTLPAAALEELRQAIAREVKGASQKTLVAEAKKQVLDPVEIMIRRLAMANVLHVVMQRAMREPRSKSH